MKDTSKHVLIVLLSVLLISWAIGYNISWYNHTNELECVTVTGKERIYDEDNSYYLVFTDKGEFTIKDELFGGNFKSSAWYGDLLIGEKYTMSVRGWRNYFWSTYPNICTLPKKCKGE